MTKYGCNTSVSKIFCHYLFYTDLITVFDCLDWYSEYFFSHNTIFYLTSHHMFKVRSFVLSESSCLTCSSGFPFNKMSEPKVYDSSSWTKRSSDGSSSSSATTYPRVYIEFCDS